MKLIFVFEGGDRIGKKTQTKMLLSRLLLSNYAASSYEVPVDDHVTYPLIYWMLENGLAKRRPNVFQLVQFFNKFLFQVILWWRLQWSDAVILDRWALSSIAYGDNTGANKLLTRVLLFFMMKPTLTLVLDGPRRTRESDDVYESDNELQRRVRESYRSLAQTEPYTLLIDASGSRAEVHERIVSIVSYFLPRIA